MESRLDHIYRRVLLTKFFTRGWGKPDHLAQIIKYVFHKIYLCLIIMKFRLRKLIGRRETNEAYIRTPASVITIDKEESQDDAVLLTGRFPTPILNYLEPDSIPYEVQTAHFQAVLPRSSLSRSDPVRPLVLQYAGTGDHFYWRRRSLMAGPMVKEREIGSILIEVGGLTRAQDRDHILLHLLRVIRQE